MFLQTRHCGTKDSNYILAILDSRMKFVAHERFQYVMLKKFGEASLPTLRITQTKSLSETTHGLTVSPSNTMFDHI